MYRYVNPNPRATASSLSRVGQVAAFGIALPADLAAALELHGALKARRGAVTTTATHRAGTVAALLADPAADVAASITAETLVDVELNALTQAIDEAARAVGSALAAGADELVARLRAEVFAPAVADLATVAALDPNETVHTLVMADRATEARVLAEAPVTHARVLAVLKCRDSLYHGSGIAASPFRLWSNPSKDLRSAITAADTDDRIVAGIRAGGTPWFATFAEVDAAERAATARTRSVGNPTPPAPARRSRKAAPAAA